MKGATGKTEDGKQEMGREQVQERNGNRYCTRMGWELVQEWDGNRYRNGKPEWEQHIAKWALF